MLLVADDGEIIICNAFLIKERCMIKIGLLAMIKGT
jgi:hypothetical protein